MTHAISVEASPVNALLVCPRFKIGMIVIDDGSNDRADVAAFVVNADNPGASKIPGASSVSIDIHRRRAKSSGIISGSGDVH